MSSEYVYIWSVVKNSLLSLLENRRRTLLTTLGIIIGVSSVIIIMAIGAGAQGLILGQVQKMGSNLIGVLPGKSDENGPPASAYGVVITTLTYDDALAMKEKRNVPNAIDMVAYANARATVSWGGEQVDADIAGTTTGYLSVENAHVESGRFFNENEEKDTSRVAVLGSSIAKDLFGQNDPIGRRIKVKNQSFEVIGVMEERGKVMFQDYDSYVFVPITSVQKLISGVRHISLLRVKVDSDQNMDRAKSDIESTLRERHDIKDKSGKDDDFSVRSMAQAMDALKAITDGLKFFLAAMAGLSLLVGGIGIMNIMLIRVAQRTREIGLRKAIGATHSDVRLQFLVEAINITLLGGVIGIIFGELFSWLVAIIAKQLGYDWPFYVSPFSIFLGVSVSMAIGLIFGLYPAKKASSLSPIEALRYE